MKTKKNPSCNRCNKQLKRLDSGTKAMNIKRENNLKRRIQTLAISETLNEENLLETGQLKLSSPILRESLKNETQETFWKINDLKDFWICSECSSSAQSWLKKQKEHVNETVKTLQDYTTKRMEENFNNEKSLSPIEIERKTESLIDAKDTLLSALEKLEKEYLEKTAVLTELTSQEKLLTAEYNAKRDSYFEDVEEYSSHLGHSLEKLKSYKCKVIGAREEVKAFKQVHAVNDSFYIWFVGRYGTINAHRLGYLYDTQGSPTTIHRISSNNSTNDWTDLRFQNSDNIFLDLGRNEKEEGNQLGSIVPGSRKVQSLVKESPSWKEINAAFGFCVQLLQILSTKVNFHPVLSRFSKTGVKFILNPSGCFSQIDTIVESKNLHTRHPVFLENGFNANEKEKKAFLIGLFSFITCSKLLIDVALDSTCEKNRIIMQKFKLGNNMYKMISPMLNEAELFQILSFQSSSHDLEYEIEDSTAVKFKDLITKLRNIRVGGYGINLKFLDESKPLKRRKRYAKEFTDSMYCLLNNYKWLVLWAAHYEQLSF
eukprot:maker-scaffold_7-snap-gene-3.64-mRNA-1 protein AED:0.00 eAED:0.00 QI:14/1/1/1/1/1/2/132/542